MAECVPIRHLELRRCTWCGSMASRPAVHTWPVCRISDQGGGIPDSELPKVWQYGYTTISQHQYIGMDGAGDADPIWSMGAAGEAGRQYKMGGLGFGLPMSRLYARYFGRQQNHGTYSKGLACFNIQTSQHAWCCDLSLRTDGSG